MATATKPQIHRGFKARCQFCGVEDSLEMADVPCARILAFVS